MKKTALYILTAILSIGVTSCKDDEVMTPVNPADDFDRMPMTMFRLYENTNVTNDPYGMRVITDEGNGNTVELAWYGIEGAAGYEIKYGVASGLSSGLESDWNNPDNLTEVIKITNPNELTKRIENLDYATSYRFAIRVLNPDGIEEHHSKWYGYGNGREWAEQAGLTTMERYKTPGVINVGDIAADKKSFTVYLNINVNDAVESYRTMTDSKKYTEDQMEAERLEIFEEFKEHFELEPNGADDYKTARLKVTHFTIEPGLESPNAHVDAEWKNKTLSLTDFDSDGKLSYRVTGLEENSIYMCNVYNGNIQIPVDARFNTVRKAVYGEPGEPIIIDHTVRQTDSIPGETLYQACQLDKIIGNFAEDLSLAEGQIFYLKGGKNYYFSSNPNLSKGFTLETDPTDVKQGLRATVFLGGMGYELDENGFPNESKILSCNFMFGREKRASEADCPIEIGELIFKNIDFDCPLAKTHGDTNGDGQGNYFANMYSNGMAVTIKALKVTNCNFKHMVRGFIRIQGDKGVQFDEVTVENCVFTDCGYFRANGGGYAMLCDGKAKSTFFGNITFSNNTVYDWAGGALFNKDKNTEVTNYQGVSWNIKCENNTFVNFSAQNGKYIIDNRNYPEKFHFTFRNNLFVLAKDAADSRKLTLKGNDLRSKTESGGTDIYVDIRDNYYLSSEKSHHAENKVPTGNKFSDSSNSFASFNYDEPNINMFGTKDDFKFKAVKDDEGNYLNPTDVFKAPNPPYTQFNASARTRYDHMGPENIWDAMKIKNLPSMLNGIGDPRWATTDPKNCYNDVAE